MKPKVSVIMPVHNVAKFLPEALQSLSAQTLAHDMEVIVIDDGSTDATSSQLAAWRPPFPVRTIRFPKRRGIVAALNTGLEQAQGHYIARMDGDDRMHPHRIEKQVNFLHAHPDVDLCGCRVRCFCADGPLSDGVRRFERWTNRLLTHESMFADRFVDAPMVHPTWLAPRRFFRELGGYRDTVGAEDYDLLLRALYAGKQLAKLPDVLLDWRDHLQRETRANPRLKRTALFRQRAAFFRNHEADAHRPLAVFGVGRFGKAIIDALREEGLSPVAIIDPYDKYTCSRVRELPVLSLNDPLSPETVLIHAYPKDGTPTPDSLHYLAHRTVYYWVL